MLVEENLCMLSWQHKLAISIALLGTSLILLIADRIQEIVFGGAVAVAMSLIAFVVSRKAPSKTISVLLFVNGGIIIIGEIITILEADFSTEGIGSTGRNIILGLLLIGLGIWKIICDQKVSSKQSYT
jgi:hypothetical protein